MDSRGRDVEWVPVPAHACAVNTVGRGRGDAVEYGRPMGTGEPRREGRLDLIRTVEAHALLAEVSASMGPAIDLDTTVRNVLAAMRRLMEFRGGSVCLVEDGYIRIRAAEPEPSAEVLAARLPVGEGIAGRVVATGESVYSPDLDHDERVDPTLRRLGSNAGMASYLAVPLISLGRVIGLLQVDSPEPNAFDAVDETLLRGLGAQVANAIESARQFEAVQALEQRQRAFLQMVSHELRTPLTIARGFTAELAKDPTLDAAARTHLLERTRAALARMGALVEEMILWTELGRVGNEPSREPTPLGPLLDRIVARSAAPELVTTSCPVDARALTDPRLLSLGLEALVDNAIKYAGGGTVTVTSTDSGTRIEVADSGPGLPEEITDRGTGGFSWAEGRGGTSGLGLGLSMAATIAEMLGGRMRIDSSPAGTVVAVDLPGGAP